MANVVLLLLFSIFFTSFCKHTFVNGDDLFNAAYIADTDAVGTLLALLEGEILSSRLPPEVNKTHGEYNRTSLMICGVDPQVYDSDPVDISCSKIAKLMIEKHVNIHHKDTNGWDALSFGAVRGFTKYSEVLLQNGADVNSVDVNEKTSLMKSITNSHIAVSELLLSYGARIDKKDNNNLTALHICSQVASKNDSFIPFMKKMLGKSPKELIDSRDKDGRTPLMHAVILGDKNISVLELLIKAGADPTLTDSFGQTATSLSKQASFQQYLAAVTADKIEQDHLKWLDSTEIKDDSEEEKIKKKKKKKTTTDEL